ncbi:hypothetical protein Tco_1313073 [Tanacetum coccineum]
MGRVRWKWVRGELERDLGEWYCMKPWGKAVWFLAGTGGGLQGLNANNGEEAQMAPQLSFSFFINILLGFPGPSDGLRLHPTVFFSSGYGLTADSSVLTLTLAFLDFGLDFAQSFPFHAQFYDDEMPEIRIYDKSSEGIFEKASYDDDGIISDFNNLPDEVDVPTNHTLRIHNAHPQSQILGDPNTPVQTRSSLKKITEAHALVSYIQAHQRSNHKDQQHCLFACFLSQFEPRKVSEALEDGSWVEAMQEELLQFKLQQVWVLVDLPNGAKVIGTKWVYRQGGERVEGEYCQGNKASFDAKQIFQIVPWVELTFIFCRQVKAEQGNAIFISQDKYVAEILKKFDLVNVKAAITPMETKLPLTKDEEAFDVDVHLYRSMIGSLMYLTASRPDIMYAVCVCSRFQVTPKTSHLNAVKRIFKYLKGKPNLGVWYPKDSPFDLEAFSDSDYGGSNLDRKSTTGGCQFLGQRLISWQCKKQTIVATSTTEAEYVAAANCCGQVLWVQNQLPNTLRFVTTSSGLREKKLITVEKINTDLNVADLMEKGGVAGFAEIVDFLRGSNLRYALTANPTIYDSLVKQFWQSAIASTKEDGFFEISATIDNIRYTITEASIRESLQLDDATGITMLPNDDLFQGMGQIGYPTDGTFTFWKSFFTPQWRYLVHHILHCISSKSGGWDQFGSNIATALICLSTGRVYNFSKLIFDGMMANLKNKKKFLMYPRFLQIILNIQTENKHPYLAVSLTKKIFGNMKRGFQGAPRPLLPSMLLVATNPIAGQEHAAQAQSQPSPPPPPIPTSTSPPPAMTVERRVLSCCCNC